VFKAYVEQKMQVSRPIFNIGYKDTEISQNGTERQKKDAVMSILNEMLFSRAGELYNYLFENNIVSPNLSYGYTISENAAYNSVAGEADDPKKVLDEIQKYIEKVKRDGLSIDDFNRGKRVMYAEFVKAFDSTDSIANNMFSFICDDAELLDYSDIISSVTFEDVCEQFERSFSKETTVLSVVLPI
jgi:predicted Zn-dependent peptidase